MNLKNVIHVSITKKSRMQLYILRKLGTKIHQIVVSIHSIIPTEIIRKRSFSDLVLRISWLIFAIEVEKIDQIDTYIPIFIAAMLTMPDERLSVKYIPK